MNTSLIVRPPKEVYDDEVLYGARRQVLKLLEHDRDESSCIILPIGTYPTRQLWTLKNIIALDNRIKTMFENLKIKHALPLQRTCWPEMEKSDFPFVCIAPESSDSSSDWTWTADSTTPVMRDGIENVDPEQFKNHPKYIIISSSQQQVDHIEKEIERMKESAYEISQERVSTMRVKQMDPLVRTINIYHDEDKLAMKCYEGEILVATPGALMKCIKSEYITFAKSKMLIFDDLDLTLQLHNFNVREIVKRYLIETHYMQKESHISVDKTSSRKQAKPCIMYMFMRKWTDLSEQFLASIMPQRTMIFGSIAEASLFVKLQYDVEIYQETRLRREKLLDLVKFYSNSEAKNEKLAIVCNLDAEAAKISKTLSELDYNAKFLAEEDPVNCLRTCTKTFKELTKPIYILSDEAIDQLMGSLADITWIIHFSMPERMFKFDQRFQLMQKYIKERCNEKKKLKTTIFLGPQLSVAHGKELYDVISRSTSTLPSTKLAMRDLIQEKSTSICWRWACTGVCRLDKLSREDRFGSYCLDGHSLLGQKLGNSTASRKWPTGGQIKITITHLVSPNEFYFWFEAHRDKNSRNWTDLNSTGCNYMKDLQEKLNAHQSTEIYTIKPSEFRVGQIYGVYLRQEKRVDRVRLTDMPRIDEEAMRLTKFGVYFAEQCEVYKIDYGVKMSLYMKNLFRLPEELTSIEPLCHQGFYLGVKPTDNEANWQFKSIKHFYDQVCVANLRDITVWLRYNHNDSHFWFEAMKVNRRLDNIDEDRLITSEPHLELIRAGFADKVVTAPACLPPSIRAPTLSFWHVTKSAELVRYAFLRRDKVPLPVYVLHIVSDFTLIVRQVEFNKQLLKLEATMSEDYEAGKMVALNYFAAGVYCVARISEGYDKTTKKTIYSINRCQIRAIINIGDECQFDVSCLDHGDVFRVSKCDLFHAEPEYLTLLPFQSIACKLADLNPDLIKYPQLNLKVREHMYSFTRDSKDNLLVALCEFNADREVKLEVPVDKKYYPLDELLRAQNMYLLIDKP